MNTNFPAVVILLAGLVGNMWAVAGDTLPNGSGTLDFSFIARPASEGCPISVEKSNQSAVIKTSDVPENDTNKVVVRLSNTFTIQQCRGALIGLSVSYSSVDDIYASIVRGMLCPQGGQGGGCSFGNGLSYFVVVPSSIVLNPSFPSAPVQWNGLSVIPSSESQIIHTMTIAPDSDNWTFSAETIVMPLSNQALTAGTMTGSYTLNLSFD